MVELRPRPSCSIAPIGANVRVGPDWSDSLEAAGLPKGFHFHDLRHTGNHLASQSGANLRELMRRLGHGSVRAAMIYQHATDDRAREIADLLGGLVDEHGSDTAAATTPVSASCTFVARRGS